jgi:predicted GH43/DUF377 family glycosyl hydrolase
MKAFALAVLWPAMILSAAESSPWKIDPRPALAPGMIGEWDDWAITNPIILKRADKWWMFYEGAIFDKNGVRSAFGIAQSADGRAWQKHSQNPIFTPQLRDTQSRSAPSVTWWRDAFWLVYVVSEDRFSPAPSNDPGAAPATTRLARSDDGLIWQDVADTQLPIFSKTPYRFCPCLYAEGAVLHLWWLGPDADEKPELLHSSSRDALTWSKPNGQPTKEIDSREMYCPRVYSSGDYYILTYVASDKDWKKFCVVTKISRNARSWTAQGPPDFPLLSPADRAAPWMVFETGGARLFYSLQREDNTRELRSAYCEKKDYASQ